METMLATRQPAAASSQIQTIVALVDFSDVTSRIIEHARALASAFSSNVVLMHGVPRQPQTVDVGFASPVVVRDPTDEEVEADKARLLGICDSLKRAGINATAAQTERIGAENILTECKWLGADLIIMGSHHHSALHDWFVGNITHELLQRATCPVLVVPAEEPAAAED